MAKPGDCPFDSLDLEKVIVRADGKRFRVMLAERQGEIEAQVFAETEEKAMERAAWLMDVIDREKGSGD